MTPTLHSNFFFLYQMLFSPSLTSLPPPDLLGFGLFLMKKQYPFEFIRCNTEILIQSDLGLCKDVCFFVFPFSFQACILCIFQRSIASYFYLFIFVVVYFVANLLQRKGSYFRVAGCYSI